MIAGDIISSLIDSSIFESISKDKNCPVDPSGTESFMWNVCLIQFLLFSWKQIIPSGPIETEVWKDDKVLEKGSFSFFGVHHTIYKILVRPNWSSTCD